MQISITSSFMWSCKNHALLSKILVLSHKPCFWIYVGVSNQQVLTSIRLMQKIHGVSNQQVLSSIRLMQKSIHIDV